MRLGILSDLHLEFAPFHFEHLDMDVMVLAGDVHTGRNGLKWILATVPDLPVIYVLGNHEFYGQKIPRLIDQLKDTAKGTNVHILENDTVRIQGVSFLGTTLWTDLALNGDVALTEANAAIGMMDFRRIRLSPTYRRFSPRDSRNLHARAVEWLGGELRSCAGQKVVVVTHHAPSPRSIAPRFAADPLNPCFASDLQTLVAGSGAILWIHGHIHNNADYQLSGTRVICNPRGYPNEAVGIFRPGLVLDV